MYFAIVWIKENPPKKQVCSPDRDLSVVPYFFPLQVEEKRRKKKKKSKHSRNRMKTEPFRRTLTFTGPCSSQESPGPCAQ